MARSLAAGRPDAEDLDRMTRFCAALGTGLAAAKQLPGPPQIPGDAGAPYYRPLRADGAPANFLRAKPKTRSGTLRPLRPLRPPLHDGSDRNGGSHAGDGNLHQVSGLRSSTARPARNISTIRITSPTSRCCARTTPHRQIPSIFRRIFEKADFLEEMRRGNARVFGKTRTSHSRPKIVLAGGRAFHFLRPDRSAPPKEMRQHPAAEELNDPAAKKGRPLEKSQRAAF